MKSTQKFNDIKEFALEYIQEAVYLIDKNAHFFYVNQAACAQLGYTKKELLSMCVSDVDIDFPQERWAEHWEELMERKNLLFESRHKTKNGLIIHVKINANTIIHNHKTYNLALIHEEVEHQRIKQKLHYQEQYQRTLLDNFPFFAWMKDKNGRILTANKQYAQIAQIASVEALEGKTAFDFFPYDLAKKYEEDEQDVMQSSKPSSKEELCQNEHGNLIWLQTWKSPVIIDGEVIGTVGCARDITEQKSQEVILRKKEQEFRSLAENAQDPIYRYDKQCRRTYINPVVKRLSGKPLKSLLGKTPKESMLVTEQDASNVMKSLQKVLQTGKTDEVEVGFETLDGSIHYYQHTHVPEFAPDGEVESVLAIGRNITAQKALQQELSAREHMFRALAENSPNIIMRYDKECRRIYANPAFAKESGIPCELAMSAKPDTQWDVYLTMHTISATEYQNRITQVILTGEPDHFTVEWNRHNDRQHITHDLHLVPEKDIHGNTIGVLAIGYNVTAFKEQEIHLRTKELEFRTLAENSPDAIVRYDQNLKRIYVNAAWEKANSLSADKVLGKSPSDKAERITDNVSEFEAMLRRVLMTGRSEEFELEWKNKDGKQYFFSFHSVAEYDGVGNIISILTISRDISTHKELQNALLSQERLFRALAENSPDSIIRYDTSCRKIYVNAMAAKTFACTTSELLGGTPSEAELLLNYKEFERQLQEVIRTKEETKIEVSMITQSGEKRWGDVRIIPEFNDNEELISILAVGRDVTERKKLEINLNATLSQFEQFINNITEMAWIKDKESHYIIVNQVLANRFGMKAKDMIGKHDSDFFNEEISREHIEADLKVMREGITLKIEEAIESLSGQELWIESIKNPFRDSNGEIIGTIGTARNITERKLTEQKMAFMAQHDALTELPNRILAKDRTKQAIAHAKRHGTKVALLFIDLDKFKDINDSLGHVAGDSLLKLIASRLRLCLRETDTLSRQGGDEFLIILPDINEPSDISIIIEKIFKALEQPFTLENHTLFVSVSIGVAIYPDDGMTFNKLYQQADIAMYQAKNLGRNTYAFHSSNLSSTMIEQLKLQNDLRIAIKNNELILYYQPQIDLSTHQIIGVEALLRWIHPKQGIISPIQFIPLAESSGLIVEIGEWVLIEACKQAALWHQKGICMNVAVNISAIQFKRGNIESVVKKALEFSNINPCFLELELTESILIHNTQEVLQTVQNLKALGIQLSIDDFGTGYSSLTYLKRFKVDKLKIDQSFIKNILQDQEDAVIVQTIIQMAKNLNLKTIAEGVENEAVLNAVQNYGCDEVQGYHFASPMPAPLLETHDLWHKSLSV
ncbi:MAG: PAS domain S-box protein [Sulfurospirillaceae bacterium]|nr:PAS domain S-box protein [Sulfurospirillaceae bacterium]